jgi:hypothetical protein
LILDSGDQAGIRINGHYAIALWPWQQALNHYGRMRTLTNDFRRALSALASLVIFSGALAAILGMGFIDQQPPFWLWLTLVGGFGASVSTV